MKWILILLIVLMIASISASCEDGQIDINSATKTELMKLVGIGEVKSQAIIDYRENKIFKSVDELIDVYGIGEVTLKNLKNQNLACVEYDEDDFEEEEEEPKIEEENKTEENFTEEVVLKPTNITLEPINLTPKNIKTEESKNESGNNYAFYGFVFFCILLLFLFILKIRKDRNNKNEFKE